MKNKILIKNVIGASFLVLLISLFSYSVFVLATLSVAPTTFSVNESVSTLYNLTINNVGDNSNITFVNVSFSSAYFTFVDGTNGTNLSTTSTFSNSTNLLSWENSTDYVVGNETSKFWFNLTASTPGTYNIIVTTINSTGHSFGFNLSVMVNDTIAPIASFGTNPIDNYNSSNSMVYFNISCSDNYNVSWIQLWTNTTGTWAANYSNWSYTNNTWLNVTVTGINESRNYKWGVWCNDSAENTNMTANRTFSYSNLTAYQGTSPVDNYNSSSPNVTFDIKCSDNYNVSTIWLWGNWNETWAVNYTNSTNFTNGTLFNVLVTGIPQGSNYKWAVYCNNTNGSVANTTNRTFSVDTTNPVVTLVYPVNDTEYNLTSNGTKAVTFTYKVTDNLNAKLRNCSLYIGGSMEDNETSVSNGSSETLHYTFENDDTYSWYVNCSDYSGHYNASSPRTITINPYPDSGDGDEDGGGGGSTEDNCPPNEKRCSAGNVEQCLNDEWKVITNCSYGCNSTNFTCKPLSESSYSGNNLTYLKNKTFDYLEINETIDFILDNSTHTIFIKNITNSSVTLQINSTVITTTLALNETKAFDLNGNGYNDLSITVKTIADDTVTLLLEAIEEPAGASLGSSKKPLLSFNVDAFTKTLVKWKWYILIFLGVVVAVFVVIMLVMKKKKSGKFAYVKINNKSVKIKKRGDGGIRIEKK